MDLPLLPEALSSAVALFLLGASVVTSMLTAMLGAGGGVLLLVLMALLDKKCFIFFPLEKKLIIKEDRDEKSVKDIAQELDLDGDKNVFQLFYGKQNTLRKQSQTVSFNSVLRMKDVRHLLLTGVMRLGAD